MRLFRVFDELFVGRL